MQRVRTIRQLAGFGFLLFAVFGGVSEAQTFNSSGSITIPQGSGTTTPAAYPSSCPNASCITVTGLTGSFTSMSVTLNYTNADSQSLSSPALLLQSPDGLHKLDILSFACGAGSLGSSFSFTLADSASSLFPNSTSCTAPLAASYKPAAYSVTLVDNFPSPGPGNSGFTYAGDGGVHNGAQSGSGTFTNTFAGISVANMNGVWKLFAVDQGNLQNNTAISWSITFNVTGSNTPTTTTLNAGSPNPSFTAAANSGVSFTAHVASATNGTITLHDNTTNSDLQTQNVDSSGNATFSGVVFSTAGNHDLTANYNGGTGFAASSSGHVTQAVTVHATQNVNQFCYNASDSIPVTQNALANQYPAFLILGENGEPTLAGTIQQLTVSINNLQVVDPEFEGLALGFTPNAASPNPSTVFQFMSYADGATSSEGAGINLTFSDTGTAQIPVGSRGSCSTCLPTDNFNQVAQGDPDTIPNPAGGNFTVHTAGPTGTATFNTEFGGDGITGSWSLYVINRASVSPAAQSLGSWCLNFTMQPNAHPTHTALTATNNPISTGAGGNTSIIATVTSTDGSGTPSAGSVTFVDGGTTLGTASVAPNGTATLTISNGVVGSNTLSQGTHHIVGSYSGTNTGTIFGVSNGSLDLRLNTTSTEAGTQPYVYCNAGTISIPGFNADAGAADVYPSNILVSNLPGTVKALTVTFNNWHTTDQNDFLSLLVGPGGNNIDFFSLTGKVCGGAGCADTLGPLNVTFDDTASSNLVGTDTTAGSFKPTSCNGITCAGISSSAFAYPACPANATDCTTTNVGPPLSSNPFTPTNKAAPAGTAILGNAAAQGVFGGTTSSTYNGNGTWSLYLDDGGINGGGRPSTLGGWCVNFTENLPNISLTTTPMTHSPTTFKRGQNASFTITANNLGPGPTGLPTLTITDTLPTGLTFTGFSSSDPNWNCTASGQLVSCTYGADIAAGNSSAFTINVSVGNTTADSITNSATLTTGTGGDGNTSDNTTTNSNIAVAGTNLTINKTHTDPFQPGQNGATYTFTVHNSGAAGNDSGPGVSTSGAAVITDALPSIFTATNIAGTNWTCQPLPAVSCTLNASIPVGGNSTLTMTLNVSPTAPSGSVTNTGILTDATDQIGTNPVSHDDPTLILGPPVITSPTTGFSTTNTTITVAGTGVANASLTVFDGATSVGTTTADGTGNWSTPITLAIGVHSLTAKQTVNSVTSAASNTVSVTIAPPAPTITAPTDNSSTTNTSVTVSGTALANASVAIFDGTSQVGATTADGTGHFSLVGIIFAVGPHTLTAKQTVNGVTSAASSIVHLTVNPLAPAITSPTTGFSTTNTSITVSGTATANAAVTVFDGATQVGTATADGSGNWSTPITFVVGPHTLTATQTVNGATSASSNSVSVTVAPLPPSITSPANNSSTNNASVTVAGTSTANAGITVLDGATQVGTTTADGTGNWSVLIAFTVGPHTLTAKQTVNTVTSAASSAVNFTVNPGAPAITAPANNSTTTNTSVTVAGTGTASGTIAVLDGASQVGSTTVDGTGHWSVAITFAIGGHTLTATQTVNGTTSGASNTVNFTVAPPAPSITAPANNSTTTNTSVTVTGTAAPNASVAVSDGSTPVGTFPADLAGNWSGPVTFAIGAHSLTAKATVNGIASAVSNTVNFTVAPPAPIITVPANNSTTTSTSVPVAGTALPNASVSVFDSGSPIGSTTADGSGNWSTTLTLAVGPHVLTAKQTVNGIISAASNTVNVTVGNKTTPTITWANPADITYGSALSSVQLNATASVPGTFVYNPPAGTVLAVGNGQTLSVQFTPTDTSSFNNASASVLINVLPAPQGPPNLVVTRTLARDTNNDVLVTLTIANTGGSTANNVQLTSAKIGTALTTTPLPQSLGNIAGGASASVTVRFAAASVGSSGTVAVLSYAGTFTGNTFSGGSRVTLP